MPNKNLFNQIIKFIIAGAINTFIDFFILNLEMIATGITSGVYLVLLNSVSFTCALINSYIINKNWTFYSKERNKDNRFPQFLSVSIFSIIINNAIVYYITTFTVPVFSISAQLWANGAKILATIVSLSCNFAGYKFLVFDGRK